MPAIHFILASHGRHGTSWVERDPNDMDLETTIRDIMSGEVEDVVRVLEVIPDENSCRDVSEDIAIEIAGRVQRDPIQRGLINFIARAAGDALALEMRAA